MDRAGVTGSIEPLGPLDALDQRLRAVAPVLGVALPERLEDPGQDAARILTPIVERVKARTRRDEIWLLWAAVAGYLPLDDEIMAARRTLELAHDATEAEIALLRQTREPNLRHGHLPRPLRVVRDSVVVDVSFSAQFDKHTGIQRVTREVCQRWSADHDLTLAAWTPEQRALRSLTEVETSRVLSWTDDKRGSAPESVRPAALPDTVELIVPWRCTVVLPEVAQGMSARPLAALAQHSGNRVVAIGYDAIPVVSADLRPPPEPNQYVDYLTVVKHTRKVAAISASAAAEFRGFASAVRVQGLPGPEVAEVMLAAEVPTRPDERAAPPRGRPLVLCVGSHELHKNHLAVLYAAERLWREGLDFELMFIGGPGWDTRAFDDGADRLRSAGRPLTTQGSVTDDELWRAYQRATFSVFPSLHEGYGLPVAESLACGTPVVTSSYGSTEEIARAGGCLLVDPRDDTGLRDAMRSLLTNPQLLTELEHQARSSVGRSWDTYARELWDVLMTDGG